MKFRSSLSTQQDTRAAAEAVCAEIGADRPDLAVLFSSHHHGPEFTGLIESVLERTNARNLIGCAAQGIIGPRQEIEQGAALALWAAWMPGVNILPFVVDQADLDHLNEPADWHDRAGVAAEQKPGFVVLPDPFSIDADRCLRSMDDAFPGSRIVGGMASGATGAGRNRLFLNDQVLRSGLVGVSLSGPVEMRAVTSQGCRPVGDPFVVTRSRENLIYDGGGEPIFGLIHRIFENADADDRALMQSALHIGVAVEEAVEEFLPGDFVIRNVLGAVENRALAITDLIRPGRTVQFHVRDAGSATHEMELLLGGELTLTGRRPSGGLLFACNGRGTHLFPEPHHDVRLVNRVMPECHVCGFFAQGEIGPVGRRTFIHGFTSTLLLFYPPAP